MAGLQGRELFRKAALDRLSTPDRLNDLVRVVGPKEWLLVVALGLLVIAVLAWSVVGRLPTNVAGAGVLGRPRQVVDIQVPVSGRLSVLYVHAGDQVHPGDLLGLIDQVEVRRELEEDRVKVRDLRAQDRIKSEIEKQQTETQAQHLQAERQSLGTQRENRLKAIRNAETLAPLMKQRAQAVETARTEGLVPQLGGEVLRMEQETLDNEMKIEEARAQLEDIDSKLKQLDADEQDFAKHLLDATTTRRNEIAALMSRIAVEEAQLKTSSEIVTPYGGRVLELAANLGQVVTAGERLGAVEQESIGPMVSVAYFSVRDAKRIRPGMRIQVTPDVVERARFGGIVGEVTSVGSLPSTKESAAAATGSKEIVEKFLQAEPQIEVIANLQADPSTLSGYKWSSSAGPNVRFSAGTTTNCRVTIESRAPITYVVPYLRSLSGIN